MQSSRHPEMCLMTSVVLLLATLHAEAAARPLLLGVFANRPQKTPSEPSTEPPPPPLPSTDEEAAVGGCPCPATLQYDPVCGTDNQTYNSLQLLLCAQRCGRDVEVSFKGRCSPLAG
ncbi:uncharacterized protein LOC124715501 [Schistocerca piceifrons]|uniref:uncharacterized protein LOC124715501 n=1 Tax=Schistocerca piceifrons TaxID=274613 RepID=UPI001F5F0761|nr:uncharacterized protein LOC124715501 [Schistocerca piceifrons]